jgi:hypothetical protein
MVAARVLHSQFATRSTPCREKGGCILMKTAADAQGPESDWSEE